MAASGLNPDVVVIGAGVAGLRTAVTLTREGRRVLVLEARSRLGGRATAFRDRVTGERVDNGQHVLLGCYRETLAFLREIDADDRVHRDPALAVTMIGSDGTRHTLRAASLPSPLNFLGGIARWSALGWRDRGAVLRLARPLRAAYAASQRAPGPSSPVSSETAMDWLRRHGQTDRLLEMLWEPLALAALNQPAGTAGAETFVRVLGEMFGAPDEGAAAIVMPIRPLDETYAEPARRAIEEAGGSVRTGARARVEIRESATTVAVGDEEWQPRAIVVAVPWFALPDVLVGETAPLAGLLHDAAQTAASAIATVNLWFDRIVLEDRFVGLPGRTLQWVFDKRQVFGGSASHLSLVSSGASDVIQRSNDALIALAVDELKGALPKVREARLVNATVIREPRATFSLAPDQPPRPATATAIPGLFLAGDWIDTGLPATIESAARSGRWAADAAAAFLRG